MQKKQHIKKTSGNSGHSTSSIKNGKAKISKEDKLKKKPSSGLSKSKSQVHPTSTIKPVKSGTNQTTSSKERDHKVGGDKSERSLKKPSFLADKNKVKHKTTHSSHQGAHNASVASNLKSKGKEKDKDKERVKEKEHVKGITPFHNRTSQTTPTHGAKSLEKSILKKAKGAEKINSSKVPTSKANLKKDKLVKTAPIHKDDKKSKEVKILHPNLISSKQSQHSATTNETPKNRELKNGQQSQLASTTHSKQIAKQPKETSFSSILKKDKLPKDIKEKKEIKEASSVKESKEEKINQIKATTSINQHHKVSPSEVALKDRIETPKLTDQEDILKNKNGSSNEKPEEKKLSDVDIKDLEDKISEEIESLSEDYNIEELRSVIKDLDFFSSGESDECLEKFCENLHTTLGYCRQHYIKNWKSIRKKKAILSDGRLQQFIEELMAKYPIKYIEAIMKDLSGDKEFYQVLKELNIDSGQYEDDLIDMDVDDDLAIETRSLTGGRVNYEDDEIL